MGRGGGEGEGTVPETRPETAFDIEGFLVPAAESGVDDGGHSVS